MNLITITEQAIEQLKDALSAENNPPGVRIAIEGGGCSGYRYFMDIEEKPSETDFTFDFEGVKIFIDPMSAPYLRGTKVDYVSTLTQSGFTFTNPQAVRTCGCNQSFSV